MPPARSPQYLPAVPLLAVLILLLLTIAAVNMSYQASQHVLRDHVVATLDTTARMLDTWQRQYSQTLPVITEYPEFKQRAIKLVEEHGKNAGVDNGNTLDKENTKALEDFLIPQYRRLGYQDYAILSTDKHFLASSVRNWVGVKVELAAFVDLLDRTLRSDGPQWQPMIARLYGESVSGTIEIGSIGLVICTPIKNQRETVAVFCLRINVNDSFYAVLQTGRAGATGEAYVIDGDGRIVSPSRFIKAPPIVPNSVHLPYAYPSLWARVPSRPDHPLTNNETDPHDALTAVAAKALSDGDSGFMENYADYRGHRVVGAARWLANMNMALIVEQDLDEVYAPYYIARNVIVGLGAMAIFLVLALTFVFTRSRRDLAQRSALIQHLIAHMPALIFLKDRDGRFLMVNPAFVEATGLSAEESFGRTVKEVLSPSWAKFLTACDDADILAGEIIDETTEIPVPLRKEGRRFFRIVRFPVYGADSSAPESIGTIAMNVTERVEYRSRLEVLNRDLEQIVEQRTQQYLHAKQEAEAATQSKSAFLANMSHEIRTPMNAVIGMSYLALNGELSPQTRNYVEKIQQASEHLLHIINAILDYSKIEAGKLNVEIEPFVLQQLIDNVLGLLRHKAEAKNLRLIAELDRELPYAVLGDALRIGQILTNFLSNAVKFTDSGSVELSVYRTAAHATADQCKIGVCFEVRDTGIGIPQDGLQQLFQPFQQIDNSSTRRFEGTGLGLAISKHLAELLGGSVAARSTFGSGSTFILELQLEADVIDGRTSALAHFQTPSATKFTDLAGARVLLVEDNDINQEVAGEMLRSFGAQVEVASDGSEALRKVCSMQFDVVLMDVQMPVMDGFEATRTIRGNANIPQPPIIAMTANALPGDRERCLAAGMDDYIAKPIDPATLSAILCRWIEQCADGKDAVIETDNTRATTRESLPYAALQALGLDTDKALGLLMARDELYAKVLRRFVLERAELPQQLDEVLQQGDFAAAGMLVHSLKSLAGTIGAEALQQICATLEREFEAQRLPWPELESFNSELTRLLAGLRQLLIDVSTAY